MFFNYWTLALLNPNLDNNFVPVSALASVTAVTGAGLLAGLVPKTVLGLAVVTAAVSLASRK